VQFNSRGLHKNRKLGGTQETGQKGGPILVGLLRILLLKCLKEDLQECGDGVNPRGHENGLTPGGKETNSRKGAGLKKSFRSALGARKSISDHQGGTTGKAFTKRQGEREWEGCHRLE